MHVADVDKERTRDWPENGITTAQEIKGMSPERKKELTIR